MHIQGKVKFFYAAKTSKGGQFIIVLNSKAKFENIELIISELPFEITEVGVVMEYCSCGSNTMPTDGDNCQQYALSAYSIQCGGGCTGDNQGSTCSYTRFDTRTGKTPID